MNRGAICLLFGVLLPPLVQANTTREWQFAVSLDDRRVGNHRFEVVERDGARRVQSEARFTVKFLFFNAYTYVHEAREQWQGNCLQAIEARTDDNGERLSVSGARRGDRFEVIATDGRAEGPACVMSFAYWNPAILQQPRLLNAQTGELNEVRVEPLGEETITVRGKSEAATRYALHTRDFRIDVWYASSDQWVQLESQTEGGQVLRYRIQ